MGYPSEMHLKTQFSRTLLWRHNGRDSVSNHQPHDCLPNRLFRRRSKKTSKPRVTGLCAGNSPGTGEFPAQMASNAENVSIWWRHHEPCLPTAYCSIRKSFSNFAQSATVILSCSVQNFMIKPSPEAQGNQRSHIHCLFDEAISVL